MKTIPIDRSIFDYLLSKASAPGEAIASTLRRELHVPEPTETIEIDDDIYDFLLSKVTSIGELPSDILRRELQLDDNTTPGQPVRSYSTLRQARALSRGTHLTARCKRRWVIPCAS